MGIKEDIAHTEERLVQHKLLAHEQLDRYKAKTREMLTRPPVIIGICVAAVGVGWFMFSRRRGARRARARIDEATVPLRHQAMHLLRTAREFWPWITLGLASLKRMQTKAAEKGAHEAVNKQSQANFH